MTKSISPALKKHALERGFVLNSIGGATGFVYVEVIVIFVLEIVVIVNNIEV
ncbi:hypothetical protein LZF95_10885 [Algoriphagus sp. AGSA1]|uniref:hypothetical protein n=1 Tax=Algoriphagus sp. AGSA1 TaxID=2907213 RepID=UPI001F2C64CE|nr:hypothetical protein [Algoriphagus sp. AGSA1]MCE7055181.1 hypothetical protein [Algoriphagus sp. AGSA1]